MLGLESRWQGGISPDGSNGFRRDIHAQPWIPAYVRLRRLRLVSRTQADDLAARVERRYRHEEVAEIVRCAVLVFAG